jgi:DNA-directed RNA polymerase I and III subunit RPAC2
MYKKKIIIKNLKNYTVFTFYNEDHTLGNILKYTINSNPFVDYVGYNVPYPTENIMHLKICSSNNEQSNHLMLGLKNSSEIGTIFDNMFCTKNEVRYNFFK